MPLTDAERQKRAAEDLAEANALAQASFATLAEAQRVAAAGTKELYGLTGAQREAIIELKEATLASARAHGASATAIAALRTELAEMKSEISGFSDAASAMHARVQGMWGMTNQWTGSITGILAAAKAGGKDVASVFEEVENRATTTAGKMNFWGSMTLKATELVNGGFLAIISQTMKLVNSLDQAMVSFKRSTGAAEEFTRIIPSLEKEFYNLGLSAEDAASVVGSLYSSMTGFTRLAPSAKRAVLETTAVLETMGVDAETTAKNMEILNRSMGYSGQQAAAITQQLFTLSQQLGISTNKMMSDFTRLGPQLVVHGQRAVQVFVRLAAAAKASGIEVDRMLSIASKFDTFSTAAESVGHLNAVLGGPYLSVMKMVEATDPTERMRLLSQATRQAGLSFDTMAYYERKALAEAVGLQDVNELALVMRGSFNLLGDSVNMNADQIERLARENKEYKTVQQELQQVMRGLAAAALPVLQVTKTLLSWLAEHTGTVRAFAVAIVGLKTAMISLNMAATLAAAGVKGLGVSMAYASPIIAVFAAGMAALGFAMMERQHSPPLFGKNSSMAMAAQQTYGIGSAFSYAAQQASLTAPAMRQLAMELNAMPDSKMIHIEKVFNAEEGVLDASKGANITAHTTRLLAAASAGSAGGQVIQNHMDVTVEMDGRVVAHQVKRQLADS
jgi:hypothetical protein